MCKTWSGAGRPYLFNWFYTVVHFFNLYVALLFSLALGFGAMLLLFVIALPCSTKRSQHVAHAFMGQICSKKSKGTSTTCP
jgi:hypothetical protein